MSDTPLLTFPCRFPLKVIGDAHPEFSDLIVQVFLQHGAVLADCEVVMNKSQAGRFQALTITFTAQNQAQLDAIYRQVLTLPFVRLAL
jgi:putative lipoic acid-binding regulatory protein